AACAFDRVVTDLQFVASSSPSAGSSGVRAWTCAAPTWRKIPGHASPSRTSRRRRCRDNRTTTAIRRAWRRPFGAPANRIDLTDDVDAERFERHQVRDIGGKAAGRTEPLTEIHVVVVIHHLIAGDRLVAVTVRERE